MNDSDRAAYSSGSEIERRLRLTLEHSQTGTFRWNPHTGEFFAALMRMIERQAEGGMLASILLVDEEGKRLRHAAAPSLPEAYNRAIDGLVIGPCVGSCGTAAYRRESVYVTEIATDPLWADFKDLALAHGLRACWSTPIFSRGGKLLGTFAMYYPQPRQPSGHDLRLVEVVTRTVAIAVERDEAEQALRQREQSLHVALANSQTGTFRWDPKTGAYLEFDENLKRLFGLDANAAVRVPEDLVDRIHPDDAPALLEAIERRRNGSQFEMEFRVLLPDGRIRWLYDRAKPQRAPDGKSSYVVGACTDITTRKRAEQESARLAAIVESSADAIISKDLNGIITSWNRGAEKVFGYTAEEAIGQPVTMLMPEGQLDEEPRILERIRRGETIEHYETVRRRKDGEVIDISLTVSPIVDARGRIIGASKIARNVTDRRAAERLQAETSKALRESEERLRAIVSQMHGGIASTDFEGRFLFANEKYCQLVGRSADELLGMRMQEITHPDDLPGNLAVFSELKNAGAPYVIEKRYLRPDGSSVWVQVNVGCVRDEQGEPKYALAAVMDIEESKRLEAELREADRRKDEFLATLAHELRNPLAPIRNSLEMLRLSGSAEPAAQRIHEMMDRQVTHMVRLVDDLLEVSRITRGKIELRLERIELATVIRSAVEASQPIIDAAGHHLAIALPPEPITLKADPVRLAQVLTNLLNNAAKYTPRGGQIELVAGVEWRVASVECRVSSGEWRVASDQNKGDADDECDTHHSSPATPHVVVRVRDNGIGIPEPMLPRVFEMFAQVNRSLKRAEGGLGIGLALARGLVEMHGGTIQVRSAGEGQGSEFIARLPLAIEAAAQWRIDAPAEPMNLARRRILVVDDNRDAADTLAMLLKMLGAEVQTVYDGASALQAMRVQRPAAVLLDIGMPGMDGYEVARRMRAQPELCDVFLIALTGWGQEDDRRRSQEAGFNAHLVKPVDHLALRKLLADLPPQTAAGQQHAALR